MAGAKSILKRFSSSAFSVLIARLMAFIAVFGFNAVLARSLAPEEFGVFALLYSLATLTSLVASFGMNRALVKVLAGDDYAVSHLGVRRVVNLGALTSIVGGTIVGLISFALASQLLPNLENSSKLWIAILFGGIVVFRNVQFVLAETFRGFHETTWSNLYGGPAGGPIPHLMFLVILTTQFLMYGETTLVPVLTIYLGCLVVSLPPLLFKLYSLQKHEDEVAEDDNVESTGWGFSLKSVWVLAIPIMLTQSFGLAISQADVWLAGALILPASLAIYCSAQRLLGFLTIPLQISNTAILSFIPELISQNRTNELQQMVGLATFISALPGLCIGAFMLAFPEFILTVAFGEYYGQAAPLLQILAIGQLVCIVTGPCETVLMMAGHQNKTLIVNIVAAAAIILLGLIGIHWWGVFGLALTMGTVTITQNLFNWWMTYRLVGVSTGFNPTYFKFLHPQEINRIIANRGQLHAS